MQFTDAAVVAGTRRREDGYLVADARIARTGIQTYLGSEVGRDDMATVRVYRPGAEVFSEATLKSAAHRPVTNDHPADAVNSSNWKQFAVGQTGDEVTGEGIFLRVPLMVSDESAIRDIEAGKRELSAGYTCTLDFAPGKTPAGEPYDAIQKNIRLNHVAIVARGRAGSEVRIGDDATQWGAAPIPPTMDKEPRAMSDALRTVVVDGLSVSTTDQGAQAITKLQNDLASSAAKIETLTADHTAVLAKKDEEIGALKADLKKAQDALPKPADLDRLVADRVALVTAAKAIDKDITTDGLTDADIRKAAVAKKLGADMVKDASEAEITGMFKALTKDAKAADPVRDALNTRDTASLTAVTDAHKAMVTGLQDAWKTKGAA